MTWGERLRAFLCAIVAAVGALAVAALGSRPVVVALVLFGLSLAFILDAADSAVDRR